MLTPKRCYHQDRDLDIIEMLNTDWGLLTIKQLVALKFFPSIRVAQKRMDILFENGDVFRNFAGNKYYYYIKPPTMQLEHEIGTNWGRIYLTNRINKKYDVFESFHYEQNYGFVRPDGLLGIRDTGRKIDNNIAYTLIEMDRSDNDFDKVYKYNAWYDSGEWESTWWHKNTWGFPRIFIITVTKKRKFNILKRIKKENVMRIPKSISFEVMLYDDVIKECVK